MAVNPTSKGVGSGTAVIHDYGAINKATTELFKNIRTDRAEDAKKKESAKAKQDLAAKQLKGELGEYDSSKIRIADRDASLKMYQEIMRKYEGRYGDMINGDPEVSNQYRQDIGNLKNFMANSADSKAEISEKYKAAVQDGRFSQKRLDALLNTKNVVGYTSNDAANAGLFSRDIARKNHVINLSKDLKESWFKKAAGGVNRTDGSGYTSESLKIRPDSETLAEFTDYVAANPQIAEDMAITFPIDRSVDPGSKEAEGKITTIEDQYQAYHDAVKSTMSPDYSKVVSTQKDKDADGNGFGDKRDFSLVPFESELAGDVVSKGIKIAKTGGKDIKSYDVSVSETKDGETVKATRSIIPATVEYDESSDSWYMTGQSTKDVYDKSTKKWSTVRGDSERVKMSPNGQIMREFKARHKIKGSLTDYWKEMQENKSQETVVQGGNVR